MTPLTRKPLEWMDTAPVRVVVHRGIAADPEAVFAILADHERWPEWFEGLRSVLVTGDPEGVGGTRRVDVKRLGLFDEEFLAWEPGARFGFAVTAMARPVFRTLNELITIDPIPAGGVRVTYTQALDPKPWIAPVLKVAARTSIPSALRAGLDGLAARAEG